MTEYINKQEFIHGTTDFVKKLAAVSANDYGDGFVAGCSLMLSLLTFEPAAKGIISIDDIRKMDWVNEGKDAVCRDPYEHLEYKIRHEFLDELENYLDDSH